MLICYRNREQEPSGPAEEFNNFYDILLKCLIVSNFMDWVQLIEKSGIP